MIRQGDVLLVRVEKIEDGKDGFEAGIARGKKAGRAEAIQAIKEATRDMP